MYFMSSTPKKFHSRYNHISHPQPNNFKEKKLYFQLHFFSIFTNFLLFIYRCLFETLCELKFSFLFLLFHPFENDSHHLLMSICLSAKAINTLLVVKWKKNQEKNANSHPNMQMK